MREPRPLWPDHLCRSLCVLRPKLLGLGIAWVAQCSGQWSPRMKCATQDRYWPDRLGLRTRGVRCDRPQRSGKILDRAFRLANGNFSLFGLANTHISVCSVWPIPIFRSVRSGHYPNFGLFGLANTHILVCLVWPIPIFWSVWSGQYLISRPRGPAK